MNRKKIVIITSRFPFPLEKGDKLRIYHQIKHLSIDYNIHLIALNTEGEIDNKNIHQLKKFCTKIHIINLTFTTRIFNLIKSFFSQEPLQVGYFYSKKAHNKIRIIIEDTKPDWCYAQLIRTAKYIQNEKNNIIDYMDAFSKGIERRIQKFPLLMQPILKREYEITKKYEKDIFNNFKHHTIITKNDRNYIDHGNMNKIHIIPNGVDTNYFNPDIKKENKKFDIIFVGNMSYPPNIEAATYICEQILPIIRKKYTECSVLIGGANPHRKIRKLQNKNIHISGWVDDIREIYKSGKIFVAPMFMGTGLQNKLLEAMAMGVPCITTTLANEALLASSSQIMIANNKLEFAEACVKILTDNEFAHNLKNKGLRFVKEKYAWTAINNKLNLLFK